MTHCREQKDNLTLVMFDVGDFSHYLGHQHNILYRINIPQCWQIETQLVPKNKTKRFHGPLRKAEKAANAASRDDFTSTTGFG